MLFSFTGLGAFSVAYDLVTSRKTHGAGAANDHSGMIAGLFATALAVLLGNLAQVKTILEWYSAEFFYPGNWFWNASRAITTPEGTVQPITEFPYFTFLYGDLHAHMIALPLTMLALAWVVNLVIVHATVDNQPINNQPNLISWLVGALAIGVLYPTNSWDWPTYLVLATIGFFLLNLRRFRALNVQLITNTLWQIALLFALSYSLFLPFQQTFGAGFTKIGLWDGVKTGLGSYLLIYGLFLLLTFVLLAQIFRVWSSQMSVTTRERLEPFAPAIVIGIVIVGVVTFGLVALGYHVAAIALPIIAVAGVLALFGNLSPTNRLILALIASAYGLTLIVEFIVIEGTIGRMNTVFKFYMQVWMLLSVLGGVAVAGVLQGWRGWGSSRKSVFSTAFALLIIAALLYPATATRAKWNIRNPNAPTTLDGMAFMLSESYEDAGRTISLAPDYAALRWMQQHIAGSPVVAEAYSGNYYRSIGNRVAMYTGLPTIIGWQGHQAQQRAAVPDARLGQRSADVALLYNSTNFATAEEIIGRYDVSYIYVGELERAYYDQRGLAKFETMTQQGLLEIVYDESGVTIYRVLARPIAAN
jgi:YYY domain-containing protein